MRAAHVAYPFLAPSRHLLRANEAREPEAKRLLCIPSDFTSPKAMPLAERLSLFKRDHSNLYSSGFRDMRRRPHQLEGLCEYA
jgi:hypothetical protein